MIGYFIESSPDITAAAHFAQLFDYNDLDGALLLKTGIFKGAIIKNGRIARCYRTGIVIHQLFFEKF